MSEPKNTPVGLIPSDGKSPPPGSPAIILKSLHDSAVSQNSALMEALNITFSQFSNWDSPNNMIGDVYGFGTTVQPPLYYDNRNRGEVVSVYLQWEQLKILRDQSRQLCASNEFAVAGLENRVNYVVGENGLNYKVVPIDAKDERSKQLAKEAQHIVEVTQEINASDELEQACMRSLDENGEFFVRLFPREDGFTDLRFLEPEHVKPPLGEGWPPETSFGVQTERNDVRRRVAYHVLTDPTINQIDGEWVPAEQITHRTLNVGPNAKRGLPTYYQVVANLRRCEDLLSSMSAMAKTRAKIALIRKIAGLTNATADKLIASLTGATINDPLNNENITIEKLRYGSILTTNANTEYEMPGMNLGASDIVEVLQAELRAVATRLQMPEWMFTAVADATYSNAFVGEGPVLKAFKRLQRKLTKAFGEYRYGPQAAVYWKVLRNAVRKGIIDKDVLHLCRIDCTGPSLESRDKKSEATMNETLVKMRAKSLSTARAENSLGDEEVQKISEETNIPYLDQSTLQQVQSIATAVFSGQLDHSAGLAFLTVGLNIPADKASKLIPVPPPPPPPQMGMPQGAMPGAAPPGAMPAGPGGMPAGGPGAMPGGDPSQPGPGAFPAGTPGDAATATTGGGELSAPAGSPGGQPADGSAPPAGQEPSDVPPEQDLEKQFDSTIAGKSPERQAADSVVGSSLGMLGIPPEEQEEMPNDEPNANSGNVQESGVVEIPVGCAMVRLVGDDAEYVKSITKQIHFQDIIQNGRETVPHVTVRFGLIDADADEVRLMTRGCDLYPFTLAGRLSAFMADESGRDYDVLYIPVKSAGGLHEAHAELGDCNVIDTYPEYTPHVTVAYVKAGTAQKYIDSINAAKRVVNKGEFVYADPYGMTTVILPTGKCRVEESAAAKVGPLLECGSSISLADEILLEQGFTGQVKDALGRVYQFVNGIRQKGNHTATVPAGSPQSSASQYAPIPSVTPKQGTKSWQDHVDAGAVLQSQGKLNPADPRYNPALGNAGYAQPAAPVAPKPPAAPVVINPPSLPHTAFQIGKAVSAAPFKAVASVVDAFTSGKADDWAEEKFRSNVPKGVVAALAGTVNSVFGGDEKALQNFVQSAQEKVDFAKAPASPGQISDSKNADKASNWAEKAARWHSRKVAAKLGISEKQAEAKLYSMFGSMAKMMLDHHSAGKAVKVSGTLKGFGKFTVQKGTGKTGDPERDFMRAQTGADKPATSGSAPKASTPATSKETSKPAASTASKPAESAASTASKPTESKQSEPATTKTGGAADKPVDKSNLPAGKPVTRNWSAGNNRGTVEFESELHRDLHDIGANDRYAARGGQNKTGQRPVKDTSATVSRIAKTLGLWDHNVKELAGNVHSHVKEQMKGMKDGEHRKVTLKGLKSDHLHESFGQEVEVEASEESLMERGFTGRVVGKDNRVYYYFDGMRTKAPGRDAFGAPINRKDQQEEHANLRRAKAVAMGHLNALLSGKRLVTPVELAQLNATMSAFTIPELERISNAFGKSVKKMRKPEYMEALGAMYPIPSLPMLKPGTGEAVAAPAVAADGSPVPATAAAPAGEPAPAQDRSGFISQATLELAAAKQRILGGKLAGAEALAAIEQAFSGVTAEEANAVAKSMGLTNHGGNEDFAKRLATAIEGVRGKVVEGARKDAEDWAKFHRNASRHPVEYVQMKSWEQQPQREADAGVRASSAKKIAELIQKFPELEKDFGKYTSADAILPAVPTPEEHLAKYGPDAKAGKVVDDYVAQGGHPKDLYSHLVPETLAPGETRSRTSQHRSNETNFNAASGSAASAIADHLKAKGGEPATPTDDAATTAATAEQPATDTNTANTSTPAEAPAEEPTTPADPAEETSATTKAAPTVKKQLSLFGDDEEPPVEKAKKTAKKYAKQLDDAAKSLDAGGSPDEVKTKRKNVKRLEKLKTAADEELQSVAGKDLASPATADTITADNQQGAENGDGRHTDRSESTGLESSGEGSREERLPAPEQLGTDAGTASPVVPSGSGDGTGIAGGLPSVSPSADESRDARMLGTGGSGDGSPERARVGNADVIADPAGRDRPARGMGVGSRSVRSDGRNDAIVEQTQPEQSLAKPSTPENPTGAVTANFKYTDNNFIAAGKKEKFKANVAAIRTLQAIKAEGRDHATPEEQQILSRYVGWGQFPELFNYRDYDWDKERNVFNSLTTDEERAAARKSTLNAHYTHPDIVNLHWKIAQRLGFNGGRYLEPSAGVGYYMGMMPDELAGKTRTTAVELDNLTGQMLKLLYPQHNIHVQGFETVKKPDNFYDLIASNVPFGNFGLHETRYNKFNSNIHDHFFLKSADLTKPGGLTMHITSTGTMDKPDSAIREELAKKFDLVAALRFPGDSHKANAGTSVVTDMLILRKRMPGEASNGTGWMNITTVPDPDGGEPIPVNEYFVNNPHHVLGVIDRKGSMYQGESKNVSKTADYDERLQRAFESLPENIIGSSVTPDDKFAQGDEAIESVPGRKNGAFVVKNGKLYVNNGGSLVEHEGAAQSHIDKVLAHQGVLAAMHKNITEQRAGLDTTKSRKELNDVYDAFVKKHGFLNDRANRQAFRSDPDATTLLALEHLDKDSKKVTKAEIFRSDTARHVAPVTKVSDPSEGLGVSLHETGGVDVKRIAQLTGLQTGDVEKHLMEHGLAFHDPSHGWQAADHYLSGNVKQKLAMAKAAAETDPVFNHNVAALEKVQPEDIEHTEITAKLGAPWIPSSDIAQFAGELLGGDASHFSVQYTPSSGTWYTKYTSQGERRLANSDAANSIYGTNRKNFDDLFEAALNSQTVSIYDKGTDGKSIFNKEESDKANEKIQQIKDKFGEWLWTDDERRERLHRHYNDNFNNSIPFKANGSHLKFPGMNKNVELRQHQKDFVWHLIAKGVGLAAHEVGTGKTYTMIAAAMELRRLGLAKKPAIACLKANIEAIANAARHLYPGAKILSLDDVKDAEDRNEKMSKIATGDYDMVICTHDNLDMMRMKGETQARYLNEEKSEIERAIEDARADDPRKNNRVVKQLEKKLANLEKAILEATDESKKDNGMAFEDSGIDHLFVDESHYYKSIPVYTKHARLKGVPNSRSDRATNMLMRTRWLMENNGGRGVTFATGTPVSNTMAELFNLQRYLQPQDMKDRGVYAFDAWAATFGDVTTSHEHAADGTYKPVTRMASFANIPELMQSVHQVMDVQRATDMKDENGKSTMIRPKKKDLLSVSPNNAEMRSFMESIAKRAQDLKGQPPGATDNMLAICTDGRKASIDMRLVNADAEDNPNSKSNQMVQNILRIHRERPGVTQMAFSEIGANPMQNGFHLYKDIIGKLVAGGIPRDKIADFSKLEGAKKDAAVEGLRTGKILVALGSTQKLGTGVNAQDRLYAVHHLDCPWVPSALEQRDGRCWRQGNMNDPTKKAENQTCEIHKYVAEGSLDKMFWGVISRKMRFINQAVNDKHNKLRSIVEDDGDEDTGGTLSADEIQAAASGDMTVLEKARTDEAVKKLQGAKERHESDQRKFRDSMRLAEKNIPMHESDVADVHKDIAHLAQNPADGDKFSMMLDGRRYTDRKEAQEAIDRMMESPVYSQQKVGTFRGMNVVRRPSYGNSTGSGLELHSPITDRRYETSSSIASVEHTARNLDKFADRSRNHADRLRQDIEHLKKQIGKPFEKQAELDKYMARREELEDRLRGMFLPHGYSNGDSVTLNDGREVKIVGPKEGNMITVEHDGVKSDVHHDQFPKIEKPDDNKLEDPYGDDESDAGGDAPDNGQSPDGGGGGGPSGPTKPPASPPAAGGDPEPEPEPEPPAVTPATVRTPAKPRSTPAPAAPAATTAAAEEPAPEPVATGVTSNPGATNDTNPSESEMFPKLTSGTSETTDDSDAAALEASGHYREFGGKHQYRPTTNAKWLTASSQADAISEAKKAAAFGAAPARDLFSGEQNVQGGTAPVESAPVGKLAPSPISVGDSVNYTGPGADPDETAEFRGYHNHAETGEKMARVIFRNKNNGRSFENSVKPEHLSKAEYAPVEEPAAEQKITPPSFREWRFSQRNRNSGTIYPNKPGQKFTGEQVAELRDWANKSGMTVGAGSGPTKIDVVSDNYSKPLDLAMHGQEGVNREEADRKASESKSAAKSKQSRKDLDFNSRESSQFINNAFGDSMNTFNKSALADFLEGKTNKFHGLLSRQHVDGFNKIGAVDGDGAAGINFGKVKAAWESHKSDQKPVEEPAAEPEPAPPAEPTVDPEHAARIAKLADLSSKIDEYRKKVAEKAGSKSDQYTNRNYLFRLEQEHDAIAGLGASGRTLAHNERDTELAKKEQSKGDNYASEKLKILDAERKKFHSKFVDDHLAKLDKRIAKLDDANTWANHVLKNYGPIKWDSEMETVYSNPKDAHENGFPKRLIADPNKGQPGQTIDQIAQTMEKAGELIVPPDRNATDYLIEKLSGGETFDGTHDDQRQSLAQERDDVARERDGTPETDAKLVEAIKAGRKRVGTNTVATDDGTPDSGGTGPSWQTVNPQPSTEPAQVQPQLMTHAAAAMDQLAKSQAAKPVDPAIPLENLQHTPGQYGPYHESEVGKAKLVYQTTPDGTINLSSVRVPQQHRGQGEAKAAMNELVKAADVAGKPIKLIASPLDKKTNWNRLVKFYVSLGFEPTRMVNPAGDWEMVRQPRKRQVGSINVPATLPVLPKSEVGQVDPAVERVFNVVHKARGQ